jgi:hypothetical protein
MMFVRNWPNDAHIGCVVSKPQNMHEFFIKWGYFIEEHKRLIKEKGLFEKDYDEI